MLKGCVDWERMWVMARSEGELGGEEGGGGVIRGEEHEVSS